MDLWLLINILGYFLGSHAGVALFYFVLAKIRLKDKQVVLKRPKSWLYFPVALLGSGVFGASIESGMSRFFWYDRQVNFFPFEAAMSLAILMGLMTYYMSLKSVYLH